jgi:single-stranded-DNA-specific exonuclease
MEWNVIPLDSYHAESLAQALNLPPLVAQFLINRGLVLADQARDFLSPALLNLPDPALMKDMDKAVNRVLKAIQQKEHIAVFGDYDVDGVMATAILLQFLTPFFPDILFYIPHHICEGYNLSIPGLPN